MRWRETCNIKPWLDTDKYEFEESRDGVVAVLKSTKWFKDDEAAGGGDVFYTIDELAETEDQNGFNNVLFGIYELADADRIWLGLL